MVSVRPVAPADFEQLYPLLHWHDSALGKTMWQRIFDYAWAHSQPHCGYGLFEGNEAVGFIGFIFCDRPHPARPDQSAQFCNLTTWVVKPPYRGHSLSLMMPIVRIKDCTVTDLSAGDDVIQISQRLGFKVLDNAVKILLPQKLAYRESVRSNRLFEAAEIAKLPLPLVERTIFKDHQRYSNCHQLVLQAGKAYCHVIYTHNREEELSYSHIQYINNLALFEQHQTAIRQHIIRQSGLSLIAIDSRLVASVKLPFSYHLPLSTPRIYRPAKSTTPQPSPESNPQPKPEPIDNLYSELMLLDFGTASSLTLGWREKALSLCSPAIHQLVSLNK